MSDMGLNASLYQQLRSYADRLDRAIALLRSSDPASVKSASADIASMLRDMSQSNQRNPHARIVWMILKRELPRATSEGVGMVPALLASLEKGKADPDDIKRLEQIALIIDRECADAGARMRGHL